MSCRQLRNCSQCYPRGKKQCTADLLASLRLGSLAETPYDLPNQLCTGASQHVRPGNSLHCLLGGKQPPVKAVADHLSRSVPSTVGAMSMTVRKAVVTRLPSINVMSDSGMSS